MIDESLLKSNFIGRDGFRWWIGQVAPVDAWKDQANGGGWGNRYKVRILGYHPYNEEELSNEDLPWAGVLLPLTAGSGAANYSQNPKIKQGDVVVGFFLDGDNAQLPMIMGTFGKTSQVPSTKNFSSPFTPFTGYTDNIKKPNGTLKADQSNESNTQSQKSPRDISPKQINQLNSKSKDKDEIPYYSGVGQKIVFGNSCNDTAVKGISAEVNNLLNKIQNASNVFLNITGEINRSVSKIIGIANNLVGQMMNSLYNKLIPLLQKGLELLYKSVYAAVLASTGSHPIAHLAGVAAQTAMIPPVKFLEDNIPSVASKVINSLFGTVSDILTSVVDNVQNFTSCAGEQFTGALLNSIVDKITSGLSSAINGVSKILSSAFKVADFLRSGISVIKSIGGLFEPGQSTEKCSGLIDEWTIGYGAKDSGNDKKKFQNIVDGMNVAASIGKSLVEKVVNKDDDIIVNNLAGYTKSFGILNPTSTRISLDNISLVKVGSLITPQVETATEIMQVQKVDVQKNQAVVLRNYVGTATTYSSQTNFTVIDPVSKEDLVEKVPRTSFEQNYGTWDIFGDSTKNQNSKSPLGGCYTGPKTTCGGPKVKIFGGKGADAKGTAILGYFATDKNSGKKTSSIIGVRVDNGGSGYKYPPFVEFEDECGLGYGAVARSIIDDSGKVIAIYMVSVGEDYPVDPNPDSNLTITEVVITDTGEDYIVGDSAIDNFGNKYTLTIDNGKIISAKPSAPINIVISSELPIITVNSDTGVGAVLKPIVGKILPPDSTLKIEQVIDCIT